MLTKTRVVAIGVFTSGNSTSLSRNEPLSMPLSPVKKSRLLGTDQKGWLEQSTHLSLSNKSGKKLLKISKIDLVPVMMPGF